MDEQEKEAVAQRMFDAVQELDVAEVKKLLSAGGPPYVWGYECDGPLQCVARLGGPNAIDIAKELLDAGADIDHQGDYRRTALSNAIVEGDFECDGWAMARYLIERGADPSLPDRNGLTPAEYATLDERFGALEAMLEAGMDPDTRGGSGGTILWYCAWDDVDSVRLLLSRGANPNLVAFQCGALQMPLQRAVEGYESSHGDEELFCGIAIALIQAGADPAQINPVPDCLSSFLLARSEKAELAHLAPATGPARKSLTL